MLERFALHQITNTTEQIIEPRLDSGLIAWLGDDGIHAHYVQSGKRFDFGGPGSPSAGIPRPNGCCVLYDSIPLRNVGQDDQTGDYENTTIWTWNPETRQHEQIGVPEVGAYLTSGGEFDGEWALLLNLTLDPYVPDGWIAVNVNTGLTRVLVGGEHSYPMGFSISQTLVYQTVSNGSAFLGFAVEPRSGQVDVVIWEVVLDTGQVIQRLRSNNTGLGGLDATPDYLVAATAVDNQLGLWVMNRHDDTWRNLDPRPGVRITKPVVGGDWCVVYESWSEPEGPVGGLYGIHIPTGNRVQLVPDIEELSFVSWDTDGKYVVAQIEISPFISTITYSGDQLYWKELPGVI